MRNKGALVLSILLALGSTLCTGAFAQEPSEAFRHLLSILQSARYRSPLLRTDPARKDTAPSDGSSRPSQTLVAYGRIEGLTALAVSGRAGFYTRQAPTAVRIACPAKNLLLGARTDNDGRFSLRFPRPLLDGDVIHLQVQNPDTAALATIDRAVVSESRTSRPFGKVGLRPPHLIGWAVDPDDEARSVYVRLNVDGRERSRTLANGTAIERPGHGFRFDLARLALSPGNHWLVVEALDPDVLPSPWVRIGALVYSQSSSERFSMALSPSQVRLPPSGTCHATLVFSFENGSPQRDPGVVCVRSPVGAGWLELQDVEPSATTRGRWRGDGTFAFSFRFNRDFVGSYRFEARSTEGQIASCCLAVLEPTTPPPQEALRMAVSPSVLRHVKGTPKTVTTAFTVKGGDADKDSGIVLISSPNGPESMRLGDVKLASGRPAGYWGGWDDNTFYITWTLTDDFLTGRYTFRVQATDGRSATGTFTITRTD